MVSAAKHAEFLKFLKNVAFLKGFASDSTKAGCNHKFIHLTLTKSVRDVAFL